MVTSLLNGCALVIDDEVYKQNTSISKMINTLEAEGTLFIKSKELLSKNARDNLSGISFIVLDWELESGIPETLPEGVRLGSALVVHEKKENIAFIKEMLIKYFIPIFIFSQQEKTSIITELESHREIKNVLDKRVFVEDKRLLANKRIKSYLETWFKKNRTVFALKMFEEKLNRSKNAFLVEVGGLDSEWANLVYNTIKLDHMGDDKKPIQYLLNSEFREFLMNSLLGRIENIDFEDVKFVQKPRNIKKEHIDSIFESIKFYKYDDEIDNSQAHEGDIYKLEQSGKTEYLININAPCDLRKKQMLLLVGKIKTKYRENGISFFQLPYFAGEPSIEFRFDDSYRIPKPPDLSRIALPLKDKEEKTYKRIGRITTPYITALRNEFAHFISRQGIPRHPKQTVKK